MKTNELMELMEKAGQKGGSELNMRSEELQEKKRAKRIKMLKKELKKKAKELVILEIALPFNPATGKADETFNNSHKFRPPVSATSAALIIKKYANEVSETKEMLMKRAGVTDWDTSDYDTFTDTDWTIFKKYRVPRLFSVNVVTINIPAITKDMSRDYAITVNRDPDTGDIVGEWPVALKINKLFRDTEYEEVADYKQKIEAGEIKHTDDQQKEYISNIYGKNPVSDDHPANFVELIELPLNNKFEISGDVELSNITDSDLKEYQHVSRYSKAMRERVQSYLAGELDKFDKYFDFFEMDMACPNDGDPNSKQGKMRIGVDTSFDKPTEKLEELNDYNVFIRSLQDFLDADIDIERSVLRSIYIYKYAEDVERQLIAALPSVYQLEDEYCTDKVIEANKDIISIAFGDEGLDLIEETDAKVSGKNAGNLDEAASASEAKTYDLSSSEFSDESPLDSDDASVDLETIDIED